MNRSLQNEPLSRSFRPSHCAAYYDVAALQRAAIGLFASVALALASVGIYSVLSYIVRGRSREIGIRTVLGARTVDVLRLVVVEG